MAEPKEKSGIQQQVEAGIEEGNKSLLTKITELFKATPANVPAPAAAIEAPKESAELIKLKTDLLKAQTDLATAQTELTKAKEDHGKVVESKEKEVDAKANLKARNKLAEVGHDAVNAERADETPANEGSKAELWEQFGKIANAREKRAFYLKHKEILNS